MFKNIRLYIILVILSSFLFACHSSRKVRVSVSVNDVKITEKTKTPDSDFESKIKIKNNVAAVKIDTKDVSPDDVVDYAKTLQGVPYVYGSCDKKKGFDCSGFLWYVFNHFNIKVPRTSSEYTNAGKEVKPPKSKKGDLILFTGSDKSSGKVGHIGIVIQNNKDGFKFIHAASGNGKGVMISGMSTYFYDRFIKIIRIFE